MKLEHFFLGLCALLLASATFMVGHYRALYQGELEKSKLAAAAPAIPQTPAPVAPAPAAPMPAPAPVVAVAPTPDPVAAAAKEQSTAETDKLRNQLKALEQENKLLIAGTNGSTPSSSTTGQPATTAPMTDLQSRISEAVSIAKVKDYLSEHGLVVLDQGKSSNLAKDQVYAVRRGNSIVARRIVITETVEENECAADVDMKGMQPGDQLKPGDEVIPIVDGI